MRFVRIVSAAVITLVAIAGGSGNALADNDDLVCTKAPESAWMSLDEIKEQLTEAGYEVRQVKAEEHCAEAYVITPEHEKAELYIDPTTGDIVNQDID